MKVLGHMVPSKHLSLFLWKEELLRPEDRPWPCYTDPANELLSGDLELLHRIESDQGTCATKSSLTMDCNCAWIRLSKVSFTDS